VVQDGVDVGEREDQVAGVSGVEADAGDLVVAAASPRPPTTTTTSTTTRPGRPETYAGRNRNQR